jgi:hypothetical protein
MVPPVLPALAARHETGRMVRPDNLTQLERCRGAVGAHLTRAEKVRALQ